MLDLVAYGLLKDLSAWGNKHRTSWFRIAVTIVGLLVRANSNTRYGEDQALTVGFAGRPKGFERTIGQFANGLPIKIPIWDCLSNELDTGTLTSLIAAVSRNVGKMKRAELFSPLDVAKSSRSHGIDYVPPKVAVTYSPRLAEHECSLFPVEGAWDLFFCFLEEEDGVNLGVRLTPLFT